MDSKWDTYFHKICEAVASNSSCMSRQIGCVMVRDRSILATGYNGPPRGVPHCDVRHVWDRNLSELSQKYANKHLPNCPRRLLGYKSGEGLHLCIAAHAERNCLINAARHGVRTEGCALYMNCVVPCKDCLIEIINAGIVEIVCEDLVMYDQESSFLLDNSGVKVRRFL